MQFIHGIGAAASGGDADVDVPNKKKDKKSKESSFATRKVPPSDWAGEGQSSSGVSVQEANEYGMRNIMHRSAQVVDGTQLSEIQRMELQMKQMQDEIHKMRTGDTSSSSVAAAPAVLSYQAHPLDDIEAAQLLPDFTGRLLSAPTPFAKTKRFAHDPHIFKMDYLEAYQTAESLKELNRHTEVKKSGKWYQNCFPDDGAEPMSYYSPFPGQSASMGARDLHFASRTFSLSLNFTLPAADMTHSEFVKKYRNRPGQDGTVKLNIPLATIRNLVAAELKDVDIDATPYHLHVYDISVTEENSNFPIEMDKIIASTSVKHSGMMSSWSTPRGVDATAQNLANGPDAENLHRYYNRILPEGASNIRRNEPADPVYVGERCKNGGEFPRWINRNWKEIMHDLVKMLHGNAYTIELPHKDKFKDFTFLQWFIFWNMKEIHLRTVQGKEQPSQKLDKDELEFNRLYSADASDTYCYTLISKRVLDSLLKEKQAKFDQDKHLMRLENVQMILWPVQGESGWDAYAEIARHNAAIMTKVGERVKFSCEMTIVYEPYRQAMMLPRVDSSSSSSFQHPPSPSQIRGRTDAIANSFNIATS